MQWRFPKLPKTLELILLPVAMTGFSRHWHTCTSVVDR